MGGSLSNYLCTYQHNITLIRRIEDTNEQKREKLHVLLFLMEIIFKFFSYLLHAPSAIKLCEIYVL